MRIIENIYHIFILIYWFNFSVCIQLFDFTLVDAAATVNMYPVKDLSPWDRFPWKYTRQKMFPRDKFPWLYFPPWIYFRGNSSLSSGIFSFPEHTQLQVKEVYTEKKWVYQNSLYSLWLIAELSTWNGKNQWDHFCFHFI